MGSKMTKTERRAYSLPTENEVQQHMREEVDINNIVNRFQKTGQLGAGMTNGRTPKYMDISSMDFQTMQNQVADINSNFMTLPAKLRRRFNHSPYQLLRFLDDENNRDEAIELGLIDAPPKVDPNQTTLLKEEPQTAVKADDEANPRHGKKAEKPAAP